MQKEAGFTIIVCLTFTLFKMHCFAASKEVSRLFIEGRPVFE